MIPFGFMLGGHLGVFTSVTWGSDGNRKPSGKKASWWRQCEALGYALLRDLGSQYSFGCCFSMYHLPEHFCRPCHSSCIAWWQDNASCHTAKIAQKQFEEGGKWFKMLTQSPKCLDLSPIFGMCSKNKSNPQRLHLSTYAANVLMHDTKAHLQRSWRIQASTDQN